jgi:hypothetical protein
MQNFFLLIFNFFDSALYYILVIHFAKKSRKAGHFQNGYLIFPV